MNVLLKNRLSGVETMDTRTLQAYHRDNDPHVFFDLADMVHQSADQATSAFDKALSDACLLYTSFTDIFGVSFNDNSKEKVAQIVKVFKYNAIVQNLSLIHISSTVCRMTNMWRSIPTWQASWHR